MKQRAILVACLLLLTRPAHSEQARVGLSFTTSVTATSVPSGPTTAKRKTFQAAVVGTGAVSATVDIEVSNFPQSAISGSTALWKSVKTFSLSGTTSANDVFSIDSCYGNYRVNVSAIAGTGAVVSVYGGEEP